MLNEQSNKLKPPRHFVDFPVELAFFDEFADHLEVLEGAEIIEFDVDGIVDMTLKFDYRGNRFLVDIYFDDYRFFVADENCPEGILIEIIDHFRKLLPE